jgi:hypothetical protein
MASYSPDLHTIALQLAAVIDALYDDKQLPLRTRERRVALVAEQMESLLRGHRKEIANLKAEVAILRKAKEQTPAA